MSGGHIEQVGHQARLHKTYPGFVPLTPTSGAWCRACSAAAGDWPSARQRHIQYAYFIGMYETGVISCTLLEEGVKCTVIRARTELIDVCRPLDGPPIFEARNS